MKQLHSAEMRRGKASPSVAAHAKAACAVGLSAGELHAPLQGGWHALVYHSHSSAGQVSGCRMDLTWCDGQD
jgi:hypothetical protein